MKQVTEKIHRGGFLNDQGVDSSVNGMLIGIVLAALFLLMLIGIATSDQSSQAGAERSKYEIAAPLQDRYRQDPTSIDDIGVVAP